MKVNEKVVGENFIRIKKTNTSTVSARFVMVFAVEKKVIFFPVTWVAILQDIKEHTSFREPQWNPALAQAQYLACW